MTLFQAVRELRPGQDVAATLHPAPERRTRLTSTKAPNARRRLSLGVLIVMASIGIALCVLMIHPFIPGLTWALALAVMATPVHRRVRQWLKPPSLAALVSVVAVAVILLTPAVFIGWHVGREATAGLVKLQEHVESGAWRQTLSRLPVLRSALQFVNQDRTPEQATREIVPEVQRQAGLWIRSALWSSVQIALALFALFFLLRDRLEILNAIRRLLPMSAEESDYFFNRIAGMTHATIFGTVVVALIQGGLGGFIFWVVGIPGAALWGVAMAGLAMIPSAGAFVIWIPAAIWLAIQGHWSKAILVGTWGALVVSLIDNLLFPSLVSAEMRLHTLPVFLTIIGGLMLFGAAGIVLGPVILVATVALVDIITRRAKNEFDVPAAT
jgi:predicted PurR-regulated permease PerM